MHEIILKRKGKKYLDWREQVFKRDGFKCRECGNDKKIHAHHIKTWEDAPELRVEVNNGLTLCTVCHNKHHHIDRKPWNQGKKMSLEQRKKLSDIKKGKPCNNLRKTWENPWNKGLKGISSGMQKGTKFSEEHKNKLSLAASNRKEISEETREKLRLRTHSEEKRAKLREKAKLQWERVRQQKTQRLNET